MLLDEGQTMSRIDDPALRSAFGFDRADTEWLSVVRSTAHGPTLGRLGPYELLVEAGHGAQGSVYKAVQPGTGRFVAIKRLGAGRFASPGMRARFEREVRSLAVLNHPGVVTVFGTEEIEGQRTLLMEWIDGAPIDAWARGRAVAEALTVFAQVCDAVHHAHQRGVIHRDLKPSNILVGQTGKPHVLDFGLAKLLDDESNAGVSAHATRSSAFLGTPVYAAPEQVGGGGGADIRADVYALGVILYQVLTGRLPFEPTGDLGALFDAIRRDDPRRPSALAPALGAELDAIALRALAKEPERRYQSVEALGADVRRFIAGETVLAHPPTPAYHLRKFVRRHRTTVILGIGAFVVTLAFAVAAGILALRLSARQTELRQSLGREHESLVRAQEARQAESDARRASDAAARDALAASDRAKLESERHRAAAEFLKDVLTGVSGIRARTPNVPVRDVLARAVRQLEAGALASQPEVEVQVRHTLALSYRALGMYAEAVPVSRGMCDLATRVHGAESLEAVRAMDIHGRNLELLGRVGEAEVVMRESVRIRLTHTGETAAVAGLYNDLASVLHEQGRFDESAAYSKRAIELSEAAGRPNAGARRNLGLELIELGRYDEAEPLTREALALHAAQPVGTNPVQRAKRNLARILHARGLMEEAESLMREALTEWAEDAGADFPEIARDTVYLAAIVADRGRVDEAIDLYRGAVQTLDKRLPPCHQWTILAKLGAARVLAEHVSPEAAEPVLREALEDAVRAQPGSEKLISDAAVALAACLAHLARFDEADGVIGAGRASLAARPPPGDLLPLQCAAALDRAGMECRRAREQSSPDPAVDGPPAR